MNVKTNRLYYLLSRNYRKNLLIQCFILFIFTVSYTQDPGDILLYLMEISVVLVGYNMILIGSRPKEFILENDRIICSTWLRKDHRSGSIVMVRGGINYKKVSLLILRVSEIEVTYFGYHKARRVGTLRLYGEIHAKNRNEDFVEDVIIPAHIDLYGVLDVESVIAAIRKAFPTAELTETSRRAK